MRGRANASLLRLAPVGACAVLCLLLANCANNVDSRYGVSASPRVVGDGQPIPKGGGVYRIGAPYTVAGRTYVPEENPYYRADGLASWYGEDFHGRLTANGEVFDLNGISAAHPTLPLPSYVRVTNLSNGRSLIVRVNDRGPYHGNRIIDVSTRAARLLGFYNRGTVWVHVEYVGRAPVEGSDDRMLEATLRQGTPAELSGTVKVAGVPAIPAAWTAAPPNAQFAGAVTTEALPEPSGPQPVSYSELPSRVNNVDPLLNARGLY